ncbi:MAG: prepilin-type N-terminal cleavage/methylation domain-containing protein [bacterium]|nr:prepilin-type N-terminal cleavage/methylation domain-containing protein [bacterium]
MTPYHFFKTNNSSDIGFVIKTRGSASKSGKGFTLIETLVAITLLTTAIAAPMTLATKSLSIAYYARDQVAASNLAQEAIESVRHVRDGNVLFDALGIGAPVDLLQGIPATDGSAFTVNTLTDSTALCPTEAEGGCPPLQTDGQFYSYRPGCVMPTMDCGNDEGWTNTQYTRSVRATFLPGTTDEIHIEVTIEWKTGSFASRTFTISENLYRWIDDGI